MADMEAKEVTLNDNFLLDKVPLPDMKRPVRSYIWKKWQERWMSPLLESNKKYKSIRDDISPWVSGFNKNRKVEVILTRLRIGHTNLTHRYILEHSNAPVCARCGEELPVKLILVHCSHYNNMRQKCDLHQKSIAEILGDKAEIDKLIRFLKEINIFYDI